MKAFWQKLLYSWRFYKLGHEEYKQCMQRIFNNNIYNIRQINVVAVIMIFGFTLSPILIEKNNAKAGAFVIAALIALLIVIIATFGIRRQKREKNLSRVFILTMIIASYVNIMAFGMNLSVFFNRDEVATMFMPLLICALFMFVISPILSFALSMTSVTVFIVSTIMVKNPANWSYDITNVLASIGICLFFTWYISRCRISAVSNTRRIEAIVSNFSGMVYQRRFNAPDWRFTFVSNGSIELFGYTPEEVISNINTFIDMVHPDDREETNKKVEEFFKPGSSINTVIYRVIMQDGSIKWIMERARILERTADGTPLLIEGYCSDITENKLLELAEHEQQRLVSRIETIISKLPGMVYQHLYKFPECTIIYASEGSKDFVGYTPEELVGGPNKFMAMVHPDDIDSMGNKYEKAIEAGLMYEHSYRLIMPDGSIKWIMDRCTVLEWDNDGKPLSVEGYMFDMTEQKKLQEAELAEIMLDSSPLCIQLWDRRLNTIGCNDAAVALYGFKNKQEYVERFLKDCSPEYQPDGQLSANKAKTLVNRTFKEGRSVFDWMHQMPDGTPMPSEITLVRVDYKNDYLVVGYTKDLRDILRLEAEAEKIYYDGLTGIYNRRYFDENMDRAIKMLSRSDGSLSFMMIDIDFFKKYNDTYGHSEGDTCLKIIAEILSDSIKRADDFVARYGGEEFVIVLPNTDENGARMVAENLLQNVRERNIPHERSDVADCVTISIGVITGKPEYTQNIRDYIKRADEMLYTSKQKGRNQYTFNYLDTNMPVLKRLGRTTEL